MHDGFPGDEIGTGLAARHGWKHKTEGEENGLELTHKLNIGPERGGKSNWISPKSFSI
jgi:hypothetical protein